MSAVPAQRDAGTPADRWTQARTLLADAEQRAAARTAAPPPRDASGPEVKARGICLDLLAIRARTRSELAAALHRREINEHVATEVLDALTAAGLIDDAAFATAWVEQRQARRGLSRAALSAELRRKGVAEQDLAPAVNAVTADAELEAARRLLTARLPSLSRLPRETALRRLCGLLERRGFGPSAATRLALEALADDAGA